MAKERLTLYDKYGNERDVDMSTEDVTLDNEGGKSLKTKLSEIDDAFDESVTKVVFNGETKVANNGEINIGNQMQPDWSESSTSYPSYIRNKPAIPTKTSELQNDAGYITSSQVPEGITVDDDMSSTSENAVQNKVIKAYVDAVSQRIDTLIGSGNVQGAIDTFNEVKAFLDGIESDETLTALLESAGKVKSVSINGDNPVSPDNNGNVDLGNVVGAQGKSAYQVAVENGFTGTEVEWLASLKGPKGDQGDTLLVDGNFNPVTDIVNDTTTGGANKAWSAEQGKLMANRSNLAAQRIALLRQLLEHAVFNGDVTDLFDALEVLDAAVESITLSQSSLTFSGSTTPGATQTLVATTDPAGANVLWSSSDSSVATVNGGVVTAVGNGTCVITASAGGLTATCNVTVSGILAVYDISLGTLSHVSVTDGNGDAISDGDEITEGSALTIVLTPDASHVIDTASVTMGGVAQTLTDGQDGEKTLTIASVSGDIAISASATYQAKDYAADPRVETITGYGVESSTSGTYKANNNYTCKIVPLDFGKFYHMTDYNWQDGGTPTGYNIALVKSDGNGGYTNIINGTDVIRPYNVDQDYLNWINDGKIYVQTTNSSNQPQLNLSEFYFGIPAASEFNDVEQVYLAVNTKFSTNNVSIDFHIREFRIDTYEDINWLAYRFTGQYTHLLFASGQTPPSIMRLIPLEFGNTYNYSGYNWSELGGANGYYSMGLIAEINGIMHLPLASEVSSYDGTFFNDGINVIRNNAPENGTFSVPTQTNFPQETNAVYLAVIMQGLGQTMNMSNFTITENS